MFFLICCRRLVLAGRAEQRNIHFLFDFCFCQCVCVCVIQRYILFDCYNFNRKSTKLTYQDGQPARTTCTGLFATIVRTLLSLTVRFEPATDSLSPRPRPSVFLSSMNPRQIPFPIALVLVLPFFLSSSLVLPPRPSPPTFYHFISYQICFLILINPPALLASRH